MADPAAVEFFEAKVRPVLVESCISCHGPKKQQGGLRLDSRAALLQGSDSGPVIVVGEPDKSLLVKAVRYAGDVQMPPRGKLPSAAVEALAAWVKMGAPYPEAASQGKSASAAARPDAPHWAFQPVRDPVVPTVQTTERVNNSVDRFVLANLEPKGLTLAPRADRRTLLRRVYFDLIGLPPTAEQTEAFVNDPSPDAFAKVVDQLLASPHYGERWGRFWLDLARYSDTKGYVFTEDRNYPFAYTYRDWVIRALNEDMPYDQFVVRQLAADRLKDGDRRDLAAMGFLTLGRRFLNNIHDIVDDRIDVVSRTFLGLTVTCARCHDHKFDPIPAKDYYSLYGVFASSTEPADLPLIGDVERTPAVVAFEMELAKREESVREFVRKRHGEVLAKLREQEAVAAYLLAARDVGASDQQVRSVARDRNLSPAVLARWKGFLSQAAKHRPADFALEQALAAIPDAEFAARAPAEVEKALRKEISPLVAEAFRGKKCTSFKEVADRYAKLFARALAKDAPADPALQAVRQALDGPDGPLAFPVEQAEKLFNRADRNELTALRKNVDGFRATNPAAPPRAMALADSPTPVTPVVFLRGNPNNRGPVVPRQFLGVLAGPNRKPFTDGSGRLELALAIASRDNPLTARVLVNRVWLNHFGAGLVRTPSDFGTRSDLPTHPALLDWLATRFVEGGWSIKNLHRIILLSQTYQQGSEASAELYRLDPENRLLARMNRRRLDFEALRDSLLRAAGQLDGRVGGRSVDLFKEPFVPRRSVYGFVDRQNLPGTLRSFDFASPDTHSPQRFQTTVPQQALFLMNSPFVVAQARGLLTRPEVAAAADPAARVSALYRIAYGRAPAAEETDLAVAFVGGQAEPRDDAAAASPWHFGFGRYDENARRVTQFTALPHWTGSAWQGGPTLPDPKTGWATLNAGGGHTGTNPDHAVIRRWVAPTDGVFAVSGTLHHPAREGDGVRARVVSSRAGELGSWTAHAGKAETTVTRFEARKGDTVDFVTDCRGDVGFDSFLWAPAVHRLEPQAGQAVWDAAAGFHGPQTPPAALTPWEEFAQVLLLSNEFAFVD